MKARGIQATMSGVFFLGSACVARAAFTTVSLGGGWTATWDSSLDPYLSIVTDGVFNDAVFIEKSAEFRQPPVYGIFPSINVVFSQTAADAARYVVICDETIRNSTGYDWTDFHMLLLDHTGVHFDPVRTGSSGGPPPVGFGIAPFTQAQFLNSDTRLDIWGGVVPTGTMWFPGDGACDGQLWIDAVPTPSEPFTVFTFKEIPTPELDTAILLALGAILLLIRRH